MNVKTVSIALILLIFVCFSCQKNNNNNVSPTLTIPNIDSIKGYYYGITSGDSIYTYTDGSGKKQQWIQSFSWNDTLYVTSADTASITAASKYYTLNFGYGDSLTVNYITFLQNQTLGQNGYVIYNASLCDTTLTEDHLTINIWYSYNKHIVSNFVLYSR